MVAWVASPNGGGLAIRIWCVWRRRRTTRARLGAPDSLHSFVRIRGMCSLSGNGRRQGGAIAQRCMMTCPLRAINSSSPLITAIDSLPARLPAHRCHDLVGRATVDTRCQEQIGRSRCRAPTTRPRRSCAPSVAMRYRIASSCSNGLRVTATASSAPTTGWWRTSRHATTSTQTSTASRLTSSGAVGSWFAVDTDRGHVTLR